jgi:hypothetical protein
MHPQELRVGSLLNVVGGCRSVVFGIVCGAMLRLMAFVAVLIGVAIVAAFANISQGAEAATESALFALLSLQVGLCCGVRAACWPP